MKRSVYYMVICLMGILQAACDKDIDKFDNSENYIYFDIPFKLDDYGRVTAIRIDSLVYSFAMDDASVTTHTFRIPVNSIGLRAAQDRSYKVIADEKATTAEERDWDQSVLQTAIIDAGELKDTLEVVVNRTEVLKKEARTLTLRLVENEHFQLGAQELLNIKISFSDILQPPSWWKRWESVFGVFVREKYAKWQEIYYYGADPNAEKWGPNAGKLMYWDQMPYNGPMRDWYPSTFMFIAKLKQYFMDHEVYPDGDTSKPRITLP